MSRHSAANPRIDVAVEDQRWRAVADLDALVGRAVGEALAASGDALPDGSELSVLLCDDAFITTLNAKWRGLAKPTNVLSFPVEVASLALGDVVVAFETVAREADEEGKSLEHHLSHMIVHGFLHLLGFDHEDDEDDEEAEAMEATETRALAALGIASPYLPPPGVAAEDKRPAR